MSMMLDVLLAPGFPHATPEGYRRGCRGAVCPGREAVGFSCADAFVWYSGDWWYRARVDIGFTPEHLAPLIRARAEQARLAEKAERREQARQRRARAARPQAAREDQTSRDFTAGVSHPAQAGVEPVRRAHRARRGAHRYRFWTAGEDATIRHLNSLGMLDREIAAEIGRSRSSVAERRKHVLHLEPNGRNRS